MNELIKIKNENGSLVVSSREVANHFEKRHSDVTKAIQDLISKGSTEKAAYLYNQFIYSEYKNNQNGQCYPEYLLTRDGFSLLVMGFTGEKAFEWKLKYIEAFNDMELTIRKELIPNDLSPQLQLLINMELKQNQLESAVKETNTRIDNIREVVAIDSTAWRVDTQNLLNKIAISLGGTSQFYRQLRTESYELLDRRMGTSLQIRLTNKRRRMADEGICKSKRDALSKIDVIADDKKLIEGYVAIVKELAIKYGIADKKII